MTATFLVKLDLPSGSSVDGLADEIQDLLADELAVIEVKPWARPSEGIEPETTDTTLASPLDLPAPTL